MNDIDRQIRHCENHVIGATWKWRARYKDMQVAKMFGGTTEYCAQINLEIEEKALAEAVDRLDEARAAN